MLTLPFECLVSLQASSSEIIIDYLVEFNKNDPNGTDHQHQTIL